MCDWYQDAEGDYLPASVDAWDELFDESEIEGDSDKSLRGPLNEVQGNESRSRGCLTDTRLGAG